MNSYSNTLAKALQDYEDIIGRTTSLQNVLNFKPPKLMLSEIDYSSSIIERHRKEFEALAQSFGPIKLNDDIPSYATAFGLSDTIKSALKSLESFKPPKINLEDFGLSSVIGDYNRNIKSIMGLPSTTLNDLTSIGTISTKNNFLQNTLSELANIKLPNMGFTELDLSSSIIERHRKEFEALTQSFEPIKLNDDIPSYATAFGLSDTIKSALKSLESFKPPKINLEDFGLTTTIEEYKRSSGLYEEMLKTISQEPTAILNPEYEPSHYEVVSILTTLSEEDETSFLESFKNLSSNLKLILLWLIHNMMMPLSMSILAAYISEYLQTETAKPQTQLIRDIKRAPKKLNLPIDTTYHRFIAVDVLNVRSKPSTTKSEIIGRLKKGTIIEVLDKKKNWIKVLYSKDDIRIQGWIFTRHTHKFEN